MLIVFQLWIYLDLSVLNVTYKLNISSTEDFQQNDSSADILLECLSLQKKSRSIITPLYCITSHWKHLFVKVLSEFVSAY